MSERIHKATLSQSQGREGWSVIFRHPVLLDRATGKPGRRVRRGLGTKEKKAAEWLVAQLNKLLADRLFWEASSRPRALARFHPPCRRYFLSRYGAGDDRRLRHPRACDRLAAIDRFRLPADPVTRHNRRRQDDTFAAAHRYGTDPANERFPSTSTARTS